MAALLDADRPPQIRHNREIGQAGCFRFFECSIDARGTGIAQTAADLTVASLASRRLAREAEIAPYFRDRTVALFSSWSEVSGLAVWDDNGLRPAVQLSGALRGGAAALLSILIRAGDAALDLHGIGLVHGALFPFGLWTDPEFGAFRFADCSLAFAIKTQIKLPAGWALISPADLTSTQIP